jgi:hypothetical protein
MDRGSSLVCCRSLRRWCGALLLLGLLAFSALQLAVGTHRHGADEFDSCQLCVGAAHGGAAPPPTVHALPPLAVAVRPLLLGSIDPALFAAAPSHAWRGRGPPSS